MGLGILFHGKLGWCLYWRKVLASIDAQLLSAFNKKDIKARKIILDAVKDHVIPHISSKTYAY